MMEYRYVFQGTAFTSESPKEVKILKDYLFCINRNGVIEKMIHPDDNEYELVLHTYQGKDNFRQLSDGQYLLPGFIDLHIHAPQWAQSGTALDLPLNEWLNTYTFPLESKFSNIDFAKQVYEDLVSTLLAHGTTTALYYATVHKESSFLLASICAEKGQRGLVGKVVMDDHKQNPEYYRDPDTASALADTEEFILAIQDLAKKENLPPFPVWDDDEFQNILPPTLEINGNAGRQIEGFLDVAHFAWVHANSFADRENSFVPSYKVEVTDYGLHAEYISTISNYTKENRHKAPPGFKWLRVFDIYPPLAARLIIYFPNGGTQWILNVPCLISARKTRLFSPMARNFDKDAPLESFYELNLQIFTEDAEMVENQKPEELPIDLTSEAHIAADKTSINYRKLLMQLGMGENYTN
ncbi:amidohydrolase family protein [Caldifermentibacillus hisashii]|uniref:amidohydrolase family protein n=1 Tax=Caldifermentibacillus hisashii TaxID=996558 RepID=UPI002E21D852|nr:amidohydrolase family protein [Caldifermentibacillus hisashii]MED4853517.1 amidohydrolase family protein [Caldifermentibacillus hisashii]